MVHPQLRDKRLLLLEKMDKMTNPVNEKIKEYLLNGGLFNPEYMDHTTVRDLLISAAAEIERLQEYEWMYKDLCE